MLVRLHHITGPCTPNPTVFYHVFSSACHLLFDRSEFEILDREHLNEVVANNRNKFRSDEELVQNGEWNEFPLYLTYSL